MYALRITKVVELYQYQTGTALFVSRRTGCRLAAASAGDAFQNATDLVREAVSYSGVLDGDWRLTLYQRLLLLCPVICIYPLLQVSIKNAERFVQ
jgi:hypothetical protein